MAPSSKHLFRRVRGLFGQLQCAWPSEYFGHQSSPAVVGIQPPASRRPDPRPHLRGLYRDICLNSRSRPAAGRGMVIFTRQRRLGERRGIQYKSRQ
jgi:hypothetical protein